MHNLVMVIHVIAAIGVIGMVLLQHGKGADMGAAFGSGASGSLFGVSGSSNFLSRATAICVAVFFATSLTLGYMASSRSVKGSVVQSAVQPAGAKADAPKTDAAPAQAVPGNGAKDVPN